jgi:hypothetical protein
MIVCYGIRKLSSLVFCTTAQKGALKKLLVPTSNTRPSVPTGRITPVRVRASRLLCDTILAVWHRALIVKSHFILSQSAFAPEGYGTGHFLDVAPQNMRWERADVRTISGPTAYRDTACTACTASFLSGIPVTQKTPRAEVFAPCRDLVDAAI